MKCQGLFPLFEVNEEGVIFWSLVLKNCWLPSQVLYDIICYINIAGWQCGTRHITTMMNESWFVDTISYRSHNWRIIAAVFPSDILYSLTNFTLSILVVTLQITEQNHHKFPNKKDGALQQLLKKLGNCTSKWQHYNWTWHILFQLSIRKYDIWQHNLISMWLYQVHHENSIFRRKKSYEARVCTISKRFNTKKWKKKMQTRCFTYIKEHWRNITFFANAIAKANAVSCFVSWAELSFSVWHIRSSGR